jgi:hypothetical protein
LKISLLRREAEGTNQPSHTKRRTAKENAKEKGRKRKEKEKIEVKRVKYYKRGQN